jgi:hypothetical protein
MPADAESELELLHALGRSSRPDAVPAARDAIARAESELGFPLPPFLRRVYETTNGGVGPGHGLYPLSEAPETLVTVYRGFIESYAQRPRDELDVLLNAWPAQLLPICDWACAIWSCLDCRTPEGPIVTSSNGEPLANTGHTLRSWLSAWLLGVDLWEEMFEPGPSRTGINPFTKQPMMLKGHGKARGVAWP